jgi:formate dehydrogenase major subunit
VQISKVETPSQWQDEFQAFTSEQLDLLPPIKVVQL